MLIPLKDSNPNGIKIITRSTVSKIKNFYGIKKWNKHFVALDNIDKRWEEIIGLMTEEQINIAICQLRNKSLKPFEYFPPYPNEFFIIPFNYVKSKLPNAYEAYKLSIKKDYQYEIVYETAKKIDRIILEDRQLGFPTFKDFYVRAINEQYSLFPITFIIRAYQKNSPQKNNNSDYKNPTEEKPIQRNPAVANLYLKKMREIIAEKSSPIPGADINNSNKRSSI